MLLTDEEIARLEPIAPFLASEASTALQLAPHYDVSVELQTHLQPGLRMQATHPPAGERDAETPPYPLNLYIGLPLDELRAMIAANDAERETLIARFGASFAPRLLRAIEKDVPGEVNLEAGVQSQDGTIAVMLASDEPA